MEEHHRDSSQKPRLLEQARNAIRRRHYSPRTDETYVHWCWTGHQDVSATMVYTHVLNKGGRGVTSPLDSGETPKFPPVARVLMAEYRVGSAR
jgi:hypothetical protein